MANHNILSELNLWEETIKLMGINAIGMWRISLWGVQKIREEPSKNIMVSLKHFCMYTELVIIGYYSKHNGKRLMWNDRGWLFFALTEFSVKRNKMR